MCWQT